MNRDFELLNKAVTGLLAGQQELSFSHEQTRGGVVSLSKAMESMQIAMTAMQGAIQETAATVEGEIQASKRQEDRYRELIDILKDMAEGDTEVRQRLAKVEERLDRLEDKAS